MTTPEVELLGCFETHDVDGIASLLDRVDLTGDYSGKSWSAHFTEMYTRSARFSDCLRLLLDHGAILDDPRLMPVLLDDVGELDEAMAREPSLLDHRVDMASAFTSLRGSTLLHVAAEFGRTNVARALIERGIDVNAPSTVDEHGRNGHTAIFHVVNAHANHSSDILRMLVDAGARVDLVVPALQWGGGFDWETTFFDVTPLSFAQMGLLPQMHREERLLYDNVRVLLKAAGRAIPPLDNVPNRYLMS